MTEKVTHVDFIKRKRIDPQHVESEARERYEKARETLKSIGSIMRNIVRPEDVVMPELPSPFARSEQAADEMLTSIGDRTQDNVTRITQSDN